MSFVAALPEAERVAWLEEVAALIESGQTPEELPVHFVIGLTTDLPPSGEAHRS
jgi:hypothetical protein